MGRSPRRVSLALLPVLCAAPAAMAAMTIDAIQFSANISASGSDPVDPTISSGELKTLTSFGSDSASSSASSASATYSGDSTVGTPVSSYQGSGWGTCTGIIPWGTAGASSSHQITFTLSEPMLVTVSVSGQVGGGTFTLLLDGQTVAADTDTGSFDGSRYFLPEQSSWPLGAGVHTARMDSYFGNSVMPDPMSIGNGWMNYSFQVSVPEPTLPGIGITIAGMALAKRRRVK